MNNHKTWTKVFIAIVAALLAGSVLGILIERNLLRSQHTQLLEDDKLTHALELINEYYMDHIPGDSLAEWILPELMSALDPHSSYIPASEFAAMNEPLNGSFEGIGIIFNMATDTVLVTNVISGGPSLRAGIVAGDRIITIDGMNVAGASKDQDEVVKMLRGPRGSEVRLGIERDGGKELLPVTVIRDVIPVKSLEASFMAGPETGYIRFGRFASTTYQEVREALESLRHQGAREVIIDLRGNGGGYLDQAIYIANEFLPKGSKIVYTEGLHSPRKDQSADGRGSFTDLKIAILIDEASASASEIVAGAIQDNDRGLIIGRRSFGKGLVQEQFMFRDSSAIRLTVARYYTPVGRSIQRPYTHNLKERALYDNELERRLEHSEFTNADSIKQDDSLRFFTPGGRIVYGGGGIMPDIFVPIDTTGVTAYYSDLFRKNLIFKYATTVTESNRREINAVKSFADLDAFFARRNLYYDFIAYADRAGVHPTENDMSDSKSLILSQLKGLIGRNSPLEDAAYYYYMMPEDSTLQRALREVKK